MKKFGFTLAEIKAIRKEGWIVGWHTDEHFPLSKLSREQKCHEISEAASKEMLHYVLSYPYGEMQAVDAECIEIAKTAGYPCAVSNLPDPNTLTGRFFLPRFTLPDNKYLLHFELSGLKYFLKNRKLLKNYL